MTKSVKWYRVLIARELLTPDGSAYWAEARVVLVSQDFKDAERTWNGLLAGSQYQALVFFEMPDGTIYEETVFDGEIRQRSEVPVEMEGAVA